MSELKILSAIMNSRDAFNTVQKYYEAGDFTDLGELVYKEVVRYYKMDDSAKWVDQEAILARLQKQYQKHSDKFQQAFDNLTDVSISNVLEDYCDVKKTTAAEMAGSFLIAKDFKKAQVYLDKYNSLIQNGLVSNQDKPVIFHDADASTFTNSLEIVNRIPLIPEELNDAIGGGLVAGCHVILYAPPETGKTAMAINLAYGMASSGKRVMYIANEESPEMYMNRLLCRFCRWPLNRVLANKEAATALARERGWANLIFVHLSPGTVPQVKELILEHKPQAVIIDQISNLILNDGTKDPEKTQLLEKLSYVMRQFYAKHGIAGISMCQADEKAIGKLFLTIKDIYYSNIGVQGQADVMIGIGMDRTYEQMSRRMLCITKNKLGGKHISFPVQLISEVSMIRSIK